MLDDDAAAGAGGVPVPDSTAQYFVKTQTVKGLREHFWRDGATYEESLDLPKIPLTKEMVLSEVVGMAFYQMMGIPTPKTYVTKPAEGYGIMSKVLSGWEHCQVSAEEALPALKAWEGLAELEVCLAFLADPDTIGWAFDNIGSVINSVTGKKVYAKHDTGASIVDTKTHEEQLKFFDLREFPQGLGTLNEVNTDSPFSQTYLRVLTCENVTKFNERYASVFDNVTPEMRVKALQKFFTIPDDEMFEHVRQVVAKAGFETADSTDIESFLRKRRTYFKSNYEPSLVAWASAHAVTVESIELEYKSEHSSVLTQKSLRKPEGYVEARLGAREADTTRPPDYSRGQPPCFFKKPREADSSGSVAVVVPVRSP